VYNNKTWTYRRPHNQAGARPQPTPPPPAADRTHSALAQPRTERIQPSTTPLPPPPAPLLATTTAKTTTVNAITIAADHHRHQQHIVQPATRLPAPQQPAPQRPSPMVAAHNEGATPSSAAAGRLQRANTLNRLDWLKRRQQAVGGTTTVTANGHHSNPTTLTLRRNLSSLGHYPAHLAGSTAAGHHDDRTPNGYSAGHRRPPSVQGPIYAPASIASPREFANYCPTSIGRHIDQDEYEQHYASASVKSHKLHHHQQQQARVQPAATPQTATYGYNYGRPNQPAVAATPKQRPGSALGQLLERFGTLGRKARRHLSVRSWSASSRRSPGRVQTPHSQIYAPVSVAGGYPAPDSSTSPAGSSSRRAGAGRASSSLAGGSGAHIPIQLPPSQPLVLDPEIYASGKRQVEADEIYAEGSRALDSNAERRLLEYELDPALMAEGETVTIIDEHSRQQADYRLLVRQLTGWLNDELAEQRIIVRDLQEDLYDGQVLCKLVERLHGIQLDMMEVTQNELAQKHKLKVALDSVNRALVSEARNSWARIRWSVEGVHAKNPIEILHLLIAMTCHYRAPIRLPPNVTVQALVFQKYQDELVRRSHVVQLTDESVAGVHGRLGLAAAAVPRASDGLAARRDAFDTLLECAPEKVHVVKQSLVRFCNRHLNKINMSCGAGDDLRPEQFSDGLLLVFLIASLEDFFVPLGNLFTTTTTAKTTTHTDLDEGPHELLPYIDANNNNELGAYAIGIEQPTALEPTSYVCSQPVEKLHNVNVALKLMEDAGMADIRQRVRAEEIVNGDLKAVLRVLYALFGRYKHL
jgi:parvin